MLKKNLKEPIGRLAATTVGKELKEKHGMWRWYAGHGMYLFEPGGIGKWAAKERSTHGMVDVLRGKGRVIVDTCGRCLV